MQKNAKLPQVFFWQNMPAHHQVGALDRLAERWGSPVTGVWMQDVSAGRGGLGWVAQPRRALQEVFLPATGWEQQVDQITSQHARDIHVFSGVGSYKPVTRAAKNVLRQDHPLAGLIVETGLKNPRLHIPRWIKSFATYYFLRHKFSTVFAIGSKGEFFYRKLGFSAAQIYPYIYQASAPEYFPEATTHCVKLVFVGNLARYKGLDILLLALAKLADQDWRLTVIGDGCDREKLKSLCVSLGLADRVDFRGLVRSDEVIPMLAKHDLCVVPSRYDGWGMATNEAIHAGLSVMVSSAAGSADLARGSGVGAVFESGDHIGLAALLRQRMENHGLLEREKLQAISFAKRISASAVGDYLYESLLSAFAPSHPRPLPPWRQK